MDSPFDLRIIIPAVCVAVFLGTVRVRPAVVGRLAMLVPLFLLAEGFFGGECCSSFEERLAAFLAWGLLAAAIWAAPAFLAGYAASFLGAYLTRDRRSGRPKD